LPLSASLMTVPVILTDICSAAPPRVKPPNEADFVR
jgi:hypothetical protein